jgi:lysophospholipase
MAKKTLRSAADAAEGQLKAGAKKLQAQLGTVEKAAGKLATKAKERLPAPADVKAELPGVRRRLKEATASVTKRAGRAAPASGSKTSAGAGSATKTRASRTSAARSSTPDSSWTVADLRAEAKRRGLTGYSGKSKAQLLAQLRR